ncbi:TPA: ATP-binding protein [Klebsiella quasipneumoniae]|nr:ATP-binding protein [Klebsiella quasipneumoniae]
MSENEKNTNPEKPLNRYDHASFENFRAVNERAEHCLNTCMNYVSEWNLHRQSGSGLIMCGRPGTGKTHLSIAISRGVEPYGNVLRTSPQRIVRAFRRTWNQEGDFTETEVLDIYARCDLLIIDEIGVQYASQSERNILFEIINERYEWMLPTILISNFPDSQLDDFLGARAMDRMLSVNELLAFDWESQRGQA